MPSEPWLMEIGNNITIATGVLFFVHDVSHAALNVYYMGLRRARRVMVCMQEIQLNLYARLMLCIEKEVKKNRFDKKL